MAKLINRLEKWAAEPLPQGQGLHLDIFRAAILMLEMGYEDEVVFEFLRRASNAVTDRTVPSREIHGAINYAKARIRGEVTLNTWPHFEPAYRAEVVKQYGTTTDELDRIAATSEDPWFYLTQLYKEDDLICFAQSAYEFGTQKLSAWKEPLAYYSYEYISPNPMRTEWGFTKDNEPSMHCLDNCGPKIFQVIEFDFGTVLEHAAILRWLGSKMPLVMTVYSGGKSMHGWFDVRGRAEEHVLTFFKDAVTLGADPKMWSPVQFTRFPCGTNNKHGRRQSVVVFQPSCLTR